VNEAVKANNCFQLTHPCWKTTRTVFYDELPKVPSLWENVYWNCVMKKRKLKLW